MTEPTPSDVEKPVHVTLMELIELEEIDDKPESQVEGQNSPCLLNTSASVPDNFLGFDEEECRLMNDDSYKNNPIYKEFLWRKFCFYKLNYNTSIQFLHSCSKYVYMLLYCWSVILL